MSVATNFEAFCDKLVVPNQDTITDRYKKITQRLNTDFWSTTSDTAHSLYIGSYGRNTRIAGSSDVDMLMELPAAVYTQYNNHQGNGQSALLQAVKKSIATTYSTSDIGADGQVIVITFTSGPKFEVLPVFANKAGTYTFADTNDGGTWKATNPRPEIEAMRKVNKECNDNLKRLCRMMRAWKEQNSVSMSSFLIDTLAYNFIQNWESRTKSYLYYDFMTRDFLKYLSERDTTQTYWAAPGSGQRVNRSGNFETKAKTSYGQAVIAIQHDKDGKTTSARSAWQSIFGTRYAG